jgi:hypothetical protein
LQIRQSMDEHDDDLTPEVHEDAAEETDSYPDTADELEDAAEDDEPLQIDDDQSEL